MFTLQNTYVNLNYTKPEDTVPVSPIPLIFTFDAILEEEVGRTAHRKGETPFFFPFYL